VNLDRASLTALVVKGSAITLLGHGGGQLVRFARSLVLTRLLFPEAFGVMALVWAVMFGLAMLSDVGLNAAIIRDKRGEDPDFLNTGWTIQVIRGAVMWLAALALAFPIAYFYGQPELAWLIPVASLTAIIAGFNSTALHVYRRRMEFRKLAVLELATEVLAFGVTIGWAMLDPTVWALVGGAVVSQTFLTLGSHVYLTGVRHQFRWERASLRVYMDFGKWIFWSSGLQFIAGQGDRMLLGYYLSMAHLGVYSIAIMLYEAAESIVGKLIRGVLFPAYGRVVREDPARLPQVFRRGRLGIDVFLILPIAVLAVIGGQIVTILYDARYHEAGWMFQVLCLRLLMAPSLINSEACLFALAQSRYSLPLTAGRAAWILAGIPVGWSLGGIKGVVWAVALSEVPVLAVLWTGLLRHGLFSLMPELRSLLFAVLGLLVGWGLLRFLF
jgi:O-antigen/teichoic acid export membrane protein